VAAAARGDRARLHFLLEISHELRTPAGIIAGYLGLARQGALPLDEAVEVAAVQAENLVALIDALLSVAEESLRSRDDWQRRARMANREAEQLCARAAASIAAARALVDGLTPGESGDQTTLQAGPTSLAAWGRSPADGHAPAAHDGSC
jgi:signal transduction histidine kinase